MNETIRQRTQMKVSKREEVDVTKIQDKNTGQNDSELRRTSPRCDRDYSIGLPRKYNSDSLFTEYRLTCTHTYTRARVHSHNDTYMHVRTSINVHAL